MIHRFKRCLKRSPLPQLVLKHTPGRDQGLWQHVWHTVSRTRNTTDFIRAWVFGSSLRALDHCSGALSRCPRCRERVHQRLHMACRFRRCSWLHGRRGGHQNDQRHSVAPNCAQGSAAASCPSVRELKSTFCEPGSTEINQIIKEKQSQPFEKQWKSQRLESGMWYDPHLTQFHRGWKGRNDVLV